METTKNLSAQAVAQEMLDFINASWTPFHAVHEAKLQLLKAGFVQLSERKEWQLSAGGKYFFTRNYSTIVAFAVGIKYVAGNGFWIIGAHTDSPCPKLKPVSKVAKAGFLQVGVQPYGGGLWHTWFDRDLSVAGRVIVRQSANGDGASEILSHQLVKIQRPILRIPTLAIHLDREVNSAGFKVNTQNHLAPVLATSIKAELNKPAAAPSGPTTEAGAPAGTAEGSPGDGPPTEPPKHHPILLELLAAELGCAPGAICDFELSVCDTQPGQLGGALCEFVFVGRLDNLCSSFCSLKALLDSTAGEASLEEEVGVRMVALFDHEEVGSASAQGAGSPVILDTLRRITGFFDALQEDPGQSTLERAIHNSFLVSADMAHCLHPNYADRHEENHQPKLHKGLVIKTNANQRYATNAVSSFLFREIARRRGLPVQDFVVRNDMGCGSTIGPILASGVGIRTVDVGAPQLSMHSCREMCGVEDVAYAYEHFKAFFQDFALVDAQIKVDDA